MNLDNSVGVNRPGPCSSCDGKQDDDFYEAPDDVVDPRFTHDARNDGRCVQKADHHVEPSVDSGASDQGSYDHEAGDEDVDRGEDEEPLVDFKACDRHLLRQHPVDHIGSPETEDVDVGKHEQVGTVRSAVPRRPPNLYDVGMWNAARSLWVEPAAQLIQAVRAAVQGDALIDPGVTARLLITFASGPSHVAPIKPIEALTDREEDVLRAVAAGMTNAEIGTELHISMSTVKFHLSSLLSKLHARNRVELVMWAYETKRVP